MSFKVQLSAPFRKNRQPPETVVHHKDSYLGEDLTVIGQFLQACALLPKLLEFPHLLRLKSTVILIPAIE